MTDPTPEELDAMVKDAILAADCMNETGTFETGQGILRDCSSAITALRAREALIEAAAIERAASVCDSACMDWIGDCIREKADAIRALITPGARTMLDQRIAEAEQAGYERGLMDAAPQFGKPITLQQAARMMLQSHTVQTMVAAGRPLDLVATLTAMAQRDTR